MLRSKSVITVARAGELASLAGRRDRETARELRQWLNEQATLLRASDSVGRVLTAQDKTIRSQLTPLVEVTARLESLLSEIDGETVAAIEKTYAEAN